MTSKYCLETLRAASYENPQLLVFLRHSGCVFFKELLHLLSKHREKLEADGFSIVLIHMGPDERVRPYLKEYGLEDVKQISDPDRFLYEAANIGKGNWFQVLGPQVWPRAYQALKSGYSLGVPDGSPKQMAGMSVIHRGAFEQTYVTRLSSELLNFESLSCTNCCTLASAM